MSPKDHLESQLLQIGATQSELPTELSEAGIVKALEINASQSGILIKAISIFGGILATLTFIIFLGIMNLWNSGTALTIMGLALLAISLWINRNTEIVLLGTISAGFYITGLSLFGYGLSVLGITDDLALIVVIVTTLISLCIMESTVLTFIAVLVVNGCATTLLVSNHSEQLIHLQLGLLIISLTYLFLNEASFIAARNKLTGMYDPVRTGIMVSLLVLLASIDQEGLIRIGHFWITSVIAISATTYLIYRLLEQLSVPSLNNRLIIVSLAFVVLVFTAGAPAISCSLLILLLSFWVNYTTGLVLGIVGLLYFISRYYYNLEFTLLAKSGILICSGIGFLLLYFIATKAFQHEAV